MKDAQFMGKSITWIIAVVLAAIIVIFGYKALKGTTDASCLTQSAFFEKTLIPDIESMYSDSGSVVEKTYTVPCGIEKVYFVDIGSEVDVSGTDAISNFPLMKNSLEEKLEKNLFLIKGNEVVGSLYAGDLRLNPPYYDCYKVRNSRLEVMLEGRKGRTGILKKDSRSDCTFTQSVPGKLSGEDLEELLDAVGEELELKQNCEVTRTITVKAGKTEVKIDNCNQNNLFIEKIPKCALKALNSLDGIGLDGGNNEVILESDPIIMWEFDVGTSLTYKIKNAIEESCKGNFRGAPFDEEMIKEDNLPDDDKLRGSLDEQITQRFLINIADSLDDIHPRLKGKFQRVMANIKGFVEEGEDTEKERYLKSAIERVNEILRDSELQTGSASEVKTELGTLLGTLMD